jgi:[ribosomal protein S5]-alanine N-acetyltransferase
MVIIETPRMRLRALTPEVYREVFTTYSAKELEQFFGCTGEALEEERKKFTAGLSMYRKSILIFQLIEKISGAVMGWCGYHTWYLPHFRAELGYALQQDQYKMKGYMSEALPYVLQYGFKEMGLKRIEALLSRENEPSMKLLARHGFVEEGVLREHYFIHDKFEDSVVFSLLEKEYSYAAVNELVS